MESLSSGSLETLTIYCLLIFSVSLVGGLLPIMTNWIKKHLELSLSFSAGVLLGASFFRMIPESAAILNNKIGLPVICGFLILYIIERFIMVHPPHETECDFHTVGLAGFVGISIHSLLDGLALGSSFIIPSLGYVVFGAVIIHKLPDALSLATLLIAAEYPRKKIALLVIAFALTTPIGAFLAFLLLHDLSESMVAFIIGVSAGTFLWLATSDILPHVHKVEKKYATLACMLAGLAAIYAGVIFE